MIATQYSTASEAIGCHHSIITRQTSWTSNTVESRVIDLLVSGFKS